MKNLCSKVLSALEGKTLATAESCTGGGIGAALTAIPGSSNVYVGGVISYTNSVKHGLLGVSNDVLEKYGAVSEQTAKEMALGAKCALRADVAVSVTGLAGPGGDEFGNPVGTVYIGYADEKHVFAQKHNFPGDRDEVRAQAVKAALQLILELNG